MADEPTDTTDTTSSTTESQPTEAAASSGGADASGEVVDSGSGGDGAADASILEASGSAGSGGDDGEGNGEDDADGKDSESAADGPPETYELAPVKVVGEDGAEIEIEIDAALLNEATPIFKDAGLSNEQANKLAPLALKVQERIIGKQADDFAALRTDWAKEAKADKEIGGKNWAETETLAARALDTFGAPKDSEFRKLLTESGFGDHPEMIRMFRRIGEKLGEDKPTEISSTGPQGKPDRVRELYPNDPPREGAK